MTNRFKEFCRKPSARTASPTINLKNRKSPKKKKPGITQSPSEPVLCAGEDSVSFDRHARVLLTEFNKTRRNQQVVAELMERTFPLRRKQILEKSSDLNMIFQDFPFLEEIDQVRPQFFWTVRAQTLCYGYLFMQLMKELERISGREGLLETTRSTWKDMAPRIVSQAQLESHTSGVASALALLPDFKGECVCVCVSYLI